ncbi:hypothetical protein [Tsuneonella suprasediminis]|uniref:hypothetical protein n=1 Tax=Tsuneonella suprasediminis TaxID=2306996 RepID=UPI001402BDBE|nr:hypothetical protein [Tsuneonella suprasediminis]
MIDDAAACWAIEHGGPTGRDTGTLGASVCCAIRFAPGLGLRIARSFTEEIGGFIAAVSPVSPR